MKKSYTFGVWSGLTFSALPSVIVGSLVFWAVLIVFAVGVSYLPLGVAIVAGFFAIVLHWASEVIHQLGHATAARSTGYPMSGIQFWGLLSTSLYPSNEGKLPASVHIRRAIGGPLASLLLTFFATVLVLVVRSAGGLSAWLAWFLFLDNLLVFTLGALMPFRFTDGGTLLYWWGKS